MVPICPFISQATFVVLTDSVVRITNASMLVFDVMVLNLSILWEGRNVPALSLNSDISITVTTMTLTFYDFFNIHCQYRQNK